MDILGWLKLGGALAVGIFAMVIWHKWEANAADAAKLPVLQKQLDTEHAKANDLAVKLAAATAKREAAEQALADWDGMKGPLMDALKEGGRNAAASKIKVCLPSADDRRLRNETLNRLLGPGQAGNAAPVPAGAPIPPNPSPASAIPPHG